MKKMIILCVMASVVRIAAMEIEYITKSPSEKSGLMAYNIQYAHQKQIKNKPNIGSYIKALPKELESIIYEKLFDVAYKDVLDKDEELTEIPMRRDVLARHILQDIRPLTIGNKKFGIIDMLKLSQEQRDQLIDIAEPGCCLRLHGFNNKIIPGEHMSSCCCVESYNDLKSMPVHITKDLELLISGNYTEKVSKLYGSAACMSFVFGVASAFVTFMLGATGTGLMGGCCFTDPVVKTCTYKLISSFVSVGPSIGGPVFFGCLNCMQHRYCADYEKCDFEKKDE